MILLLLNLALAQVTYETNGKALDSREALLAAIRGEQVKKCTVMEAGVNKKGTSVSLKRKK